MPAQVYIIPKSDQYTINRKKYFKIKLGNKGYRDLSQDIQKNLMSSLKVLAKFANIRNHSTMRKAELIRRLEGIILFE